MSESREFDRRLVRTTTVGALVMLIVVVIVTSVSGCSSSPRRDYATAQDAYISVVSTLLEGRAAGEISQDTWDSEVLPLIHLGNEALIAADLATSSGGDAAGPLAQLRDILVHLRPFLINQFKE